MEYWSLAVPRTLPYAYSIPINFSAFVKATIFLFAKQIDPRLNFATIPVTRRKIADQSRKSIFRWLKGETRLSPGEPFLDMRQRRRQNSALPRAESTFVLQH
jgi:hypothetical protein